MEQVHPQSSALERIDTHHHLWRHVAEQYPWMSERMTVLRRDYLLDDLVSVTRASSITGTIVVQARQCVEETVWLAEISEGTDLIRGVVGWAPLIDPGISTILENLASSPKVKAMRHVLHDEADDFYMLRSDFNRGVSYLKDLDLAYDLLIFERHLPQTIEFVDRHPNQRFVLDHIGKPLIRDKQVAPWRDRMYTLAARENVYCKLSGMVTEADWTTWTSEDLKVYWDLVLEAFGPSRIMFGSDWPVLTVASTYERWVQTVEEAISNLTANEREWIFSRTAMQAYKL